MEKDAPGKLYLVATPIGNLKDITLRALEVLKSVDLIACEDTRHSSKLLRAYEIHKPLVSYHEHNEEKRTEELLRVLQDGKNVALISDAGTPLISDPGFRLVRRLAAEGIGIESLPGPCAAVNALVVSGLPTDSFYFLGFLPAKSAARVRKLEFLKEHPSTLIIYESAHRIQKLLKEAFQVLGPRPMTLGREMTKKFEEILRGRLGEVGVTRIPHSWKGEFVLVIEGYKKFLKNK